MITKPSVIARPFAGIAQRPHQLRN